MRRARIVALDIGGSHVTAAVVDGSQREIVAGTRRHVAVDEGAASEVILETWARAALQAVSGVADGVDGVGIAMPAPFDPFPAADEVCVFIMDNLTYAVLKIKRKITMLHTKIINAAIMRATPARASIYDLHKDLIKKSKKCHIMSQNVTPP